MQVLLSISFAHSWRDSHSCHWLRPTVHYQAEPISRIFFFCQGFFKVNKSRWAAGLPRGSPSLACIRFLLPAGGAEEEIRRARADVVADLTWVHRGVLLRWRILLCSADWKVEGRWIHDDAEAFLLIQIQPPALTFQEQNTSNKAALTFPPFSNVKSSLLRCFMELLGIKYLHASPLSHFQVGKLQSQQCDI